jgi:catechol 2,3-dioxygenase-like lactoylglutathione lyase family enzyme
MAFSGFHHVAFITNDMKKQLEFFTQVVGMELVALFPMHGVPGASHCFLKMGKDSFLSFVQIEGMKIEGIVGVSHAHDGASPVAGGAVQHISVNVSNMEDLLNLRDRLRSHGYAVLGPMSHGMAESMYLGAPEGILLEFSTTEGCAEPMAPDWIEAETGRALGMSNADLDRYAHPTINKGQKGAVPQPALANAVYPTPIPRPMFDAFGYLSDAELREKLKFVPPEAQQRMHT